MAHPKQAQLQKQAADLALSLKEKVASNLYKYACPETGKTFYLEEKVATPRSPYTGKTLGALDAWPRLE